MLGIGFVEGQSYIKVYDDCGIGKGAIIKPVFGDVQPIPEEGFEPGIDPFTGLPMVNPGLDDNGFLLGTQGQITLPDGSVIPAGLGTARPTSSTTLYVDPKTGQYTTNPTDGSIVAVSPITGEAQYLPTPTTGRPGDENQQVGRPVKAPSARRPYRTRRPGSHGGCPGPAPCRGAVPSPPCPRIRSRWLADPCPPVCR